MRTTKSLGNDNHVQSDFRKIIFTAANLLIDSLRQGSLNSQALCVYCLGFGPESRRPNLKTCLLVHLKMTKKEADLMTR